MCVESIVRGVISTLTFQESSHSQDWTNARADNLRRRYQEAGLLAKGLE